MKQVLQNLKTGAIEIANVPCPEVKPGHLLVRTHASVISAGTERMLLDFGKATIFGKARQQPDRIRQVLNKVRSDGLTPTLEAVRAKLDKPLPLGYCNAGEILEVGRGVEGFSPGDRVVSNGPHAEIVQTSKNLCAKIPESVYDEEAAFAVMGAIGLQGIRLVQPTLGESMVVIGLGLIGLIAVQLLRANGCRVLSSDLSTARCDLARQFGAEVVDLSIGENPLDVALAFSKGKGVDGVLITAATESNEPIQQAARMCRKRGRIVLVGVTGLELQRSDFYQKELSFQVSCSYGPGRYDPHYEEKGHDYPLGYVRWTEQRNFEAVLDMMAEGNLDVKPLITHRFPFEEAEKAYALIAENKEPYIGIVLEYQRSEVRKHKSEAAVLNRTVQLSETPTEKKSLVTSSSLPLVAGFIGAGNFTGQVFLPAIAKTGLRLKTIASSGGVSGTHFGKKFGFELSTTDSESIIKDPDINTVFITTRHNSHASFVLAALKAGKHVFVEKPLCLTLEELNKIYDAYLLLITDKESREGSNGVPLLMVGFNRRFAPHVVKMKELLDSVNEPKSMIMTVNAGFIPPNHWTQDPGIGGGRIIGEACHYIDLLRFLAGTKIKKSGILWINSDLRDTATITLGFEDDSIGTIHYFANGNRRFPKERLEVFAGKKILQLDNFKFLKGYGWKNFRKMRLWRQDKGHEAEVKAFIDAVQQGGPSPIPFEEIVEVTETSIELANRQKTAETHWL